MSDEKRQTRLLPFRVRRAAHAHAAGHGRDARGLSGDAGEFSGDAELGTLLRAWEAPAPSAAARERVLAEFRACGVRAPFWRRALTSELRVPVPFAACAALALLAALFALAARTQAPAQTAAANNAHAGATAAAAETVVKIVEVPVERVVTRVVYVERDAPRGEAQQLAAVRQSTSTQRNESARGAVAQSNSNSEAAARRTAFDSGPQSSAEPTSYFTRVDMADFQPSEKMELRIVRRGKTDEK